MDLTLAEFVLTILLGSCGLVLASAIISRSLHARAEHRAMQRRVICRLCLHAFESTGTERTVDCPVCGATNERGRSRRPA